MDASPLIDMIFRQTKIEKATLLLLTAVLLGLGLRLYGIRWGLPDVLHPDYSYHPDEMLHLQWARMLASGEIIGKHFMYGGTFYFTVLNAYFHLGKFFEAILGEFNLLGNVILLGRYFHTAVALLTILVIYQCGQLFFNRMAGGLAAIMLALMPAHIICAQRMRPDEFAALFAAIVIWLSWHVANDAESKKIKYYVYSGLALGVATALRFPLVILASATLTAHLLPYLGKGAKGVIHSLLDKRLVIMCGAWMLGYAISSPHTFYFLETFLEGMEILWLYQASSSMGSIGTSPGLYQYGWGMLSEALGYPLYFLAMGGVVLAIYRRSRADIIMLAVCIPYFILTTFASWVVVRYTLPLLPPLAILAASFVVYMGDRIRRHKVIVNVFVSIIFVITLFANIAYLKMESGVDVRDSATKWIQNNIPQGASIMFAWGYVGDYYFNPVVPEGFRELVYLMNKDGDHAAFFRESRSDYLILHGHISYEQLADSRYKSFMVFKRPVELLGLDFAGWFTSHDYVIANPELHFFKYQD